MKDKLGGKTMTLFSTLRPNIYIYIYNRRHINIHIIFIQHIIYYIICIIYSYVII